jgi:hypothetical protein
LWSGLSLRRVPAWSRELGAARLVSTPSRPGPGLARDCHFTGFPEFEQFCIPGFPRSTQALKSVASADSATPASNPYIAAAMACRKT